MKSKKELRDSMIDDMIDWEMECNFSDSSYVREIIVSGCKGLDEYDDKDLADQYEGWIEYNDDQETKDKLVKFKALMSVSNIT